MEAGNNPSHLHRVGSLPSALGWGSRPMYSYRLHPSFSKTYDWVVVRDGSCYRSYMGDIEV